MNQKAFLERYARQEKLPNIRHYIDDDESGRFFDRSAYVRMILSKREQSGKQSRYTTIHNLKAAANMLMFLQTNGIKDMAGLEEKVEDMYGKQRGIAEELKPIDRRLKTLDEHI